jgi:signal transduction histidine kinase
MKPLALRGRVVVAATLVLAIGVGAIGVGLNVLLDHRLSADANAVLRARADAPQTTVSLVDGRVVVREGTRDEAFDREAWVFADGAVVARPVTSAALYRAATALSRLTGERIRDAAGDVDVRLLAEPVYATDRRTQIATIVVGVSLAPYEDTERFARLGTIIFGALVLLGGAAIASRAVQAGLRPVADMARAAEDYSEHDLSRRFALGPARDEITGLAATLDGLLDRLQASMQREQRLSAEIAHELRTPLSGIRAEAELAQRSAVIPPHVQEALGVIIAAADRMNAAIDALLTAARQVAPTSAVCELQDAVRLELDASHANADRHDVTLELAGTLPQLLIAADASFVAQTLQPLLDNAIRHASARVTIHARPSTSCVAIAIEDDGSGIANEDLDRVFEAGVHTPGGSGSGLGLALSRRLARSIGGDVHADPADGGARLVVELPVVARASAPDQGSPDQA